MNACDNGSVEPPFMETSCQTNPVNGSIFVEFNNGNVSRNIVLNSQDKFINFDWESGDEKKRFVGTSDWSQIFALKIETQTIDGQKVHHLSVLTDSDETGWPGYVDKEPAFVRLGKKINMGFMQEKCAKDVTALAEDGIDVIWVDE